MSSNQIPATFEIKSGTTKDGKACLQISMDTEEIHQHMVEFANCLVQSSFIPEVEINHIANTMWRYDVINIPHPEHSRRDVHIEHLQEALIEVIASISIESAKKRVPVAAKRKPVTRRKAPLRSVK